MTASALALAVTLLVACTPARAQDLAQELALPAQVHVLPVVFVPADQAAPDPKLRALFTKHLRWAQLRYRELLHGATFILAKEEPDVVWGRWPLTVYRSLKDDAAQITSELLAHYETDRFRCGYVFVILFVNPCENHPAGGGRPLNGGLNRGGGLVQISSWGLTEETSFQSTLRHELGHSFGLCHVDVYGYDMKTSRSLMSYNQRHHTRGLIPSTTPGELIPEDRWALAQNQRAFPGLAFKRLRDQPGGYARKPKVELGPMEIPGQARWQGAGYELRVFGRWVKRAPTWSRSRALAHLRDYIAKHPGAEVKATHEAERLRPDEGPRQLSAPRAGYELFFDGVRVGHEPSWTREQGLANLRGNRERYRAKRVQARYNGVPLPGE